MWYEYHFSNRADIQETALICDITELCQVMNTKKLHKKKFSNVVAMQIALNILIFLIHKIYDILYVICTL